MGVFKVYSIIDIIYSDFINKLKQVDEDNLTLSIILQNNLKLSKNTCDSLSKELNSFGINEENILSNNFQLENFRNENKIIEHNVLEFLTNYKEKYSKIYFESLSSILMKSISDRITDEIIRILESQRF